MRHLRERGQEFGKQSLTNSTWEVPLSTLQTVRDFSAFCGRIKIYRNYWLRNYFKNTLRHWISPDFHTSGVFLK